MELGLCSLPPFRCAQFRASAKVLGTLDFPWSRREWTAFSPAPWMRSPLQEQSPGTDSSDRWPVSYPGTMRSGKIALPIPCRTGSQDRPSALKLPS